MHFAHGNYLALLLLIPMLMAFYFFAARQRKEAMQAFAGPEVSRRLLKAYSETRFWIKGGLLIVAFAFGVLALLQPRWGYHWEEISSRGVDIYLALDLSKSMYAEDVEPNRLERAKRKISDFLKLAEGDRVGLIGFAGRAFVQCPLTLDYNAVQSFLNSMSPNSISPPGTDIAAVVDKAVESFSSDLDKAKRSGALVILSDGEDHAGSLNAAAEKAKAAGVRVYGIGVGKEAGAPIPDPSGSGFKKDSRGELILSRLEEKNLKELALATGGSYVRSVASDDDLKMIYGDIRAQVQEHEAIGGRQKKEEERFQWPLFLAFGFLLFQCLWADGLNSEGRAWTENTRKMFSRLRRRKSQLAAVAFLGVIFLYACKAQANLFESEAWQGEQAYTAGKYDEALDHFLKAQVESPNNVRLKYNLANTYYKLGKFTEAQKLYESTREAKQNNLNENSEYNLGNSAFREQKWDEAIEHYQKSLQLNPNDAQAKQNLALAQQRKAQPPPPPQKSDSDKKPDEKSKPDENKEGQGSSQKPNPADEKKSEPAQNRSDQKNAGGKPEENQTGGDKNQPHGQNEKNRAGKENKPAEAKPESAGNDSAKTSETKAAEEGKESKPEPGKMSKEEAKDWLSRVREGQNRDQGRQSRNSNPTSVEKDW